MSNTIEISRYGYVRIENVKDMIRESIIQLATVGLNRKEIAAVLGINRNTVGQYALDYDIKITEKRSPLARKRKLADRTVEEFQELLKTHSLEEIAEAWGISMVTLRRWRREKGLTVSGRGTSSRGKVICV